MLYFEPPNREITIRSFLKFENGFEFSPLDFPTQRRHVGKMCYTARMRVACLSYFDIQLYEESKWYFVLGILYAYET